MGGCRWAVGGLGEDAVVTGQVVGDFPGGEMRLAYPFTLEGELIRSLTIVP